MIIFLKIVITLIIIWLFVAVCLSMAILKEHHDNPGTFRKFSIKDEIQIAFAWPALLLLFTVSAVMDLYAAIRDRSAKQ